MPRTSLKSFDQRLKDGDIFNIQKAASIIGVTPRHLQRLCDEKKIAHERRLGSQYFFTPEQAASAFQTVYPTTPKTQGTRK